MLFIFSSLDYRLINVPKSININDWAENTYINIVVQEVKEKK